MSKKILFLILLILLFKPKISLAEQYNFYEAEYIPNIYMNKYEYSTNTIYFQQARFFRNQTTGQEAYCIEPFIFFYGQNSYNITNNPRNLSTEQIDRIKKIAYFGYNYKNHTDTSWYAVTQLMIWKTTFPNSGDYYFTNTLNGYRVNYYDSMIQEIENLINNYKNQLSINNQNITIVEDTSKVIDQNEELSDYFTENNEITINDNSITINPLKEGNYSITIQKNINRNTPALIFQSPNSQNMIIRGELIPDPTRFNINVIKTKLTIIKEDADKIIAQGEASLDGTLFNIYDENNNFIKEAEIINGIVEINNLNFGKYYLEETKTGIGYQLNNERIPFEISEENSQITITIKNKVIEKKIKIRKSYGEENNYLPESNITFEIYDINNILVASITTNEHGEAETILPFGTYTFIQKNTTEGYQLNEAFIVKVDNIDEELIELLDYKIEVPNTYKNKIKILNIKKLFKSLWLKTYSYFNYA